MNISFDLLADIRAAILAAMQQLDMPCDGYVPDVRWSNRPGVDLQFNIHHYIKWLETQD